MAQEVQETDTAGDTSPNGIENRKLPRRSVLWPAKLRVGKHDLACQIWNLSLGGARVKVDLPLQEGVKLVLTIAGRGEIPATVAWAKGDLLGVAFDISTKSVRRLFEDRLHVLGLTDEAG